MVHLMKKLLNSVGQWKADIFILSRIFLILPRIIMLNVDALSAVQDDANVVEMKLFVLSTANVEGHVTIKSKNVIV